MFASSVPSKQKSTCQESFLEMELTTFYVIFQAKSKWHREYKKGGCKDILDHIARKQKSGCDLPANNLNQRLKKFQSVWLI